MPRRSAALSILTLLLFPISTLAQDAAAHVRTGMLTPSVTVNPLHHPVGRALPSTAQSRPKGARPIHPAHSTFAALSQVPEAVATPFGANTSGELVRNFNGVSSLDSAVTNFGGEFKPPDQGLCVGNGFVVEPVNSAYTIYKRDGSVVAGPFNVNVMFDEGLTEFTSDPRCHFDPSTHTWFAIILFISADNTSARTDIAVNTSGDPTTPWTVYHLDATDDGTNGTPVHVGCPCLGDQPLLGMDRENIYISTNEFSILGPQANGAQIYAVSKRDLINGAANIHFVQFENLTIAGNMAMSVQPALTSPGEDSGGAEYFLQSIDPTQTVDNRLGVWALTHGEAVSDGEIPTL